MSSEFTLDVEASSSLPPYSDKAILPQTVLSTILNSYPESNLPYPLIFKIANIEDESFTYIGVKEFSSSKENLIILPQLVLEKLMCPSSVSIKLIENVPKANFLKLKPLQFYSDIKNWKFFLENKLNKFYTVLIEKEKLVIEDNNLRYELIIEGLNEKVACVIDTDIILDIVPLNDMMASQQLEFNKISNNLENVVEIDNEMMISGLKPFMDGQFIPTIYKIDLAKFSNKLIISLENLNYNGYESIFNIDLIIGLDKLVNLENFRWTTLDQDFNIQYSLDHNKISKSKIIEFDLNTDEITNKLARNDDDDGYDRYLYLIPFTWEFESDVKISIINNLAPEETEESIVDYHKKCSNCEKQIPIDKFLLHESFCLRNNIKCSCGLIFLKEIPSYHWHCDKCLGYYSNSNLLRIKHNKLYHQKYKCNQCSSDKEFSSFVDLIVNHKSSVCPNKLHECKFCHLIVPQGESTYKDRFENLTNHENSCGNKTSECYKCNKILRLKDLSKHLKFHDLEKLKLHELNKIIFNKCCNENCINLLNDTNNELGLCNLCFGPLYVPSHDPTNIKFQSRIERKYILQLTKGCGNAWCNNKYCLTGNPASHLNAQPFKELLSFVNQELLTEISKPSLPVNINKHLSHDKNKFWFCTIESISNKKGLLDLIISEGQYDEEIVYKAINERYTEMDVRNWLDENAIKINGVS